MDVYLLIGSILTSATAGIFCGFFNKRAKGAAGADALYTMLVVLTATVGWFVLFAIDGEFLPEAIPYSLLFGVCYAAAQIGMVKAIACGPLSLTVLLVQFSCVLTVVWGFLFWGVTVSPRAIIGLVLASAALVCCVVEKGESRTLSGKWLLFALLSLLGNAGCIISQRTEQIACDGRGGNMMMAFAMVIASAACIGIFGKSRKENCRHLARRLFPFPLAAGVCNLFLNLATIRMATGTLSPALIYPAIAIGTLSLNILFSVLFFGERPTARRWIGIAFGAAAVVLLS